MMSSYHTDIKKRHSSSESDEDSNVRHDRFKSERFQDNSGQSSKHREERHTHRPFSHKHRERSPRSVKHKDESSSKYTHEPKNNHDNRDRGRKLDKSRSEKVDKKEKLGSERRDLDHMFNEIKAPSVSSSAKNKLSCLLKNFDKKIESKRNNSETSVQSNIEIGPALPPHLKSNEEPNLSVDTTNDALFGPALPIQLQSSIKLTKTAHSNVEDSDKEYVVSLPPHMKRNSHNDKSEDCTSSAKEPILPTLSQLERLGQEDMQIPSSTNVNTSTDMKKSSDCQNNAPQKEIDVFGPALPPKIQSDMYGPSLPPTIKSHTDSPSLTADSKKTTVLGPTLPPEGIIDQEMSEEEDEDLVGPLPEGKMNITQYTLGLRALDIKRKLENEKNGSSSETKKREEWMLELPPEKAANLGLGPRNFRMREAPDMSNRSEWTETPADKQRRLEKAERGEAEPVDNDELRRTAFVKERNDAMEKLSKEQRDEERPLSLLELHQKKLKKKKKKEEKEGKKKERRPFDRNIDLQVNRFDDAQKKAIFKKAQLLDTRFSSGESKFL